MSQQQHTHYGDSQSSPEEMRITYERASKRPLEEYRFSTRFVLTLGVIFLSSLSIEVWLLWFALTGHQEPGSLIIYFPLLLFIAAISFIALVRHSPYRDKKVIVYEDGLSSITRKGRRTIFWEQVLSYKRVDAFPGRSLRISLSDGTEMVFNEAYERIESLSERVVQAVMPFLLSQSIHHYLAGQPQIFGNLEVNLQGLYSKRGRYHRLIPWHQLDRVDLYRSILFNQPTLYISETGERGRWWKIPGITIANREVFLALITFIKKVQ